MGTEIFRTEFSCPFEHGPRLGRLIQLVIQNGIPVIPVPGPSALITALSVSGLPISAFATERSIFDATLTGGPIFVEFVVEREDNVYPMIPSNQTVEEMLDNPFGASADTAAKAVKYTNPDPGAVSDSHLVRLGRVLIDTAEP